MEEAKQSLVASLLCSAGSDLESDATAELTLMVCWSPVHAGCKLAQVVLAAQERTDAHNTLCGNVLDLMLAAPS